MLQIKSFVFNPLGENTLVVYDETKECIIIDPGCSDKEENAELRGFIENQGLRVKMLINTHCHIDHVLGNQFVKDHFKVNLLIHRLEEPVLRAVESYAANWGFHQYQSSTPDEFLEEGDEIVVGNQAFSVLFLPGHSPGHVGFYSEKNKVLIGGDVLFLNSIGRTDLPGGNHQTLLDSIRQKVFTLPDDVKVYPGHGPETTVGYEKRTNPFCAIEEE